MKSLLPLVVLAAVGLSSCATQEATGVSSSPPVPAAPANPSPAVPASPGPSLKETARLDRELGNSVVPYPFDSCAVIQKPFGPAGPKHRRIYQGHEVLFCCTPCVRAFDMNPDPYMPRIVAAAKEEAEGIVTPPLAR